MVRELERVLDTFNLRLGLPLPRISIQALQEEGTSWRLLAFEVPIASGHMPPAPWHQALAHATLQALRRNATLFFGTQEASALLNRANQDMPEVVKEVMRMLSLQKVTEILRRLLEEEVPIRNTRDILEALSDVAQREKDVYALNELVRIALKRQLCHQAAPDGVLRALVLTPELETLLQQSVHVSNGVQQLALDPQQARLLLNDLAGAVRQHGPGAVVTSVGIRRHVRKLIEAECFDTPVLSFHELMPTLQLEVSAQVGVPQVAALEAAA